MRIPHAPDGAATGEAGPRWAKARKVAAYGAALAMLPYFVIKVFWTVDGLRGGGLQDGAWSTLDWAAVNAMTVGMAGAAILLGLALGQRWGMRIPAWLLLSPAWIGMGFLVSMIPLLPVMLLLAREDRDAAGSASLPSWELPLIGLSFAGFALGLAVAGPLYAGQRWPEAFAGRVDAEGAPAGASGPLQVTAARIAMAVCAVIGLPQLYWGAGGTLGLERPGTGDLRWHLLTANDGLWALIAAWGVWTLTRRRSGMRFWVPVLLTWVASGSLFAWGSWRALFMFATTSAYPSPEPRWALALEHHFGALAGLLILLVLLLLIGDRGHASRR
ncbi:PAT1 domain containing protein [Planomonospora sphaerica]|uniref:PAT1 domain containing protein n=1 Tax=Planomonospora sphaerica TaxID=161355 RepID=A0A171DMI7_9ACTN|nr:hypothetical protein [Planomonospora sphaerica]GAT70189.1 PAT1 domain containing protein [Planomonospora sphaerica]